MGQICHIHWINVVVLWASSGRHRIMALNSTHSIFRKWYTLACLLKWPGHMWKRHDLILCMNGHEKLPNNLVLDSLLSRDILYGMLKTYWKPLVCTLSFLSNSALTYCMDIPECSHELLMCFSPTFIRSAHRRPSTIIAWWRHQMEVFSLSTVNGEFP